MRLMKGENRQQTILIPAPPSGMDVRMDVRRYYWNENSSWEYIKFSASVATFSPKPIPA